MCYTLPKIWMGRIQKYWDKIMPTGFPVSDSAFSLTFDEPEVKAAVEKFEEELGTDESVVNTLIPEGTFVSNYIGVYDVEGIPGEKTLLSPEKITDENISVLHYNTETNTWESVEGFEIIDGYVWGTLESFSPIAIVSFRKDMHLETSLPGVPACKSALVCEGNPVIITQDVPGANGKTIVKNMNTGKSVEIPAATYIVGGSIDGSHIDKTNITVTGLYTSKYAGKIISGSLYVPADKEDLSVATVDEINVTCLDLVLGGLTGSFGAVRTKKVNYTLHNCIASYVGCGEGFAGMIDVKESRPSFASRSWAKEVNLDIKNLKCTIFYCGQNCEYFYADSINCKVDGGEYYYFTTGGSNMDTNKCKVDIKNATVEIFQSVNRGDVASSEVVFSGANNIKNLFVGGDATDSTVNGTTGKLKYEINGSEGTYNIVAGTEGGATITSEDAARIVESIKVSRSANITISDELKEILGSKYIVK